MSDAQHAGFQPTRGTDLATGIETVLRAHIHRHEDWVTPAALAERAGDVPARVLGSQFREVACLQYHRVAGEGHDVAYRIRPADRDRLALALLRGGGDDE